MSAIHALRIDSRLLRGNRAGDPHERTLLVVTPAAVADTEPLPLVWMVPGHGGSQGGFLSGDPWRESLPDRLDRLVRAGMPPVRLALPDLFTRYGGSQAIDSEATGPYARHLWEELAPAAEARFSTTAHGMAGHSSGGYAAIVHGMRHADRLRAVACHAGDMLFEFSYQPDFPKALSRIRAEGGVERYVQAFEAAQKKQDGRWLSGINVLCMAACYSPDAQAPLGIRLPVDLETCELLPDEWARWLEQDPVRMIERPEHQAALKSLALVYVDAGNRDEFNLQWGARALRRRLQSFAIPHVYEEFDDGHMGTSYRFDRSLPLLAKALRG